MPTQKQINSPDTEPPDNTTSPVETASKLGVIAALCCLLPVFYFLSTGPVIWAIEYGYMPSAMDFYILKFYWPILYLAERWDTFSWLLNEYYALWI